MNIGMVYDLRTEYLKAGYSEEEVAELDSESTIDALDGAIRSLGHRTDRIGRGRELCRRLASGERWDLVFNIAEGLRGRSREAQVPALLEMYGVPYTFSDPLVCAVTLDKACTKRILQWAGLRTPGFHLVSSTADIGQVALAYPLFAKPVAEGTGKGVDARSRADTPRALAELCERLLEEFKQPVLVEKYLPGREFTTALLGTGPDARVLGTMEVLMRAGSPSKDYGFEIKEKCEQFVDYPAMERGPLRDEAEALALATYRVLECRDAGRVDLRLDTHGRPSIMEINPLPGLHPSHSDLPMIATREGMGYRELIGAIVESAATRRCPGDGRISE